MFYSKIQEIGFEVNPIPIANEASRSIGDSQTFIITLVGAFVIFFGIIIIVFLLRLIKVKGKEEQTDALVSHDIEDPDEEIVSNAFNKK